MVESCPIAKWSGIWISSDSKRTKYSEVFIPAFEYQTGIQMVVWIPNKKKVFVSFSNPTCPPQSSGGSVPCVANFLSSLTSKQVKVCYSDPHLSRGPKNCICIKTFLESKIVKLFCLTFKLWNFPKPSFQNSLGPFHKTKMPLWHLNANIGI